MSTQGRSGSSTSYQNAGYQNRGSNSFSSGRYGRAIGSLSFGDDDFGDSFGSSFGSKSSFNNRDQGRDQGRSRDQSMDKGFSRTSDTQTRRISPTRQTSTSGSRRMAINGNSGNHAFCRSRSSDERPFCVDGNGGKHFCASLKLCPKPALPDHQLENELAKYEKLMRTDVKFRHQALEINQNYTDVSIYFEPRYPECNTIELYQAFVAHVVGNEKIIQLLESCDKQRDGSDAKDQMQFPNYVPYMLKWVLHLWNICCFACVYWMLAKLIIQPLDSSLPKVLPRGHVKPVSTYKMNGYLTST